METMQKANFTFGKIFKCTIAPILMMVFISLYGIVDGFFISNFAGLTEYAGVNVIMPVIMIIGGIGFMFGTGGSALTGKYLGQGKTTEASATFTMIIKLTVVAGLIISVAGYFLVKPIAEAIGKITNGSTQEMVDQAIIYGQTLCFGQIFFMLQNVFQSFLVVNEKQGLGFVFTVCAGVTNMILDYLFIGVFHWGVRGAALGTIAGYVVGSVAPLIYFLVKRDGIIKLVKCGFNIKDMLQSCANGSSEFVSNISSSIVGLCFNVQLLRYYGQNGVAAYGTLMYVSFIFVAIYVGYSIGLAPTIAFNYGAENKKELKNLLTKSLIILASLSGIMFVAGETLGPLFAKLYVGSDPELLDLTVLAFRIFSIQFIFCGISIFTSSFFTALNNGLISALVSFLRTIVFQIGFVFILPLIMGGVGIWWSIPSADIAAFILSISFLIAKRKKYGYFDKFVEETKLAQNDVDNNEKDSLQ